MTVAAPEKDWMDGHQKGIYYHLGPKELDALHATEGVPHETSGVLRMNRAGMAGPQISKTLGLPIGPQMMQAMQRGLDQETAASEAGVPIHDAGVKAGTK